MCRLQRKCVCTACQQNHHIENCGCVFNDKKCVIQNKEICILCKNKITINGKCVSTDSINCKEFVDNVCKQCEEDHYKDTTGCLPKQDKYKDCEYVSVVMLLCLECNKSNVLVDISCVSSDDDNNTVNLLNIQTMSKTTTDNCILRSSKGCLRCSDGYYRTPNNNTKLCNPQKELNNCLNKTTSGCTLCVNGFAPKDNLCYKCGENCTYCDATFECSKCDDNNILRNGVCVHFSQILNCISSQNSLCWECADGFKLSDDKIECFANTNCGLVVGIEVVCVVVMVVVVIATVIIVVLIVFKKKDNKHTENICVFKMSRSNITMTKLESDILSNKNEISFGDESDKIQIGSEGRELLCVGNSSKSNMKIQITTKDKCDKYKIRTEPQIVTLKSGFACEFEKTR
ncbi:hypothetical protein EIN_531690, partial [Entamoeba invadens IP1]